jgi:sarcosine oxidase alpha subunit family protein
VSVGYGDPELVKRRTGALTGPCQGKYCLQAFCAVLAEATGADPSGAGSAQGAPTTARPPIRPIRLGDLVASEEAVEA